MSLTRETLIAYLDEQMGLDPSEVDDETLLFSTNLLDSFSLVDLIAFIENETGCRIEPADVTLDNLDSIGRILRFISTGCLSQ